MQTTDDEIPWGRKVCFVGTTNWGNDTLLHWAESRALDATFHTCRLSKYNTAFWSLEWMLDHFLEPGMYVTWHKEDRLELDTSGWEEWKAGANAASEQKPITPIPSQAHIEVSGDGVPQPHHLHFSQEMPVAKVDT